MKSKVLLLASLSVMGASQLKAQLNVGSTSAPVSSAVLQATSTTKGFLPPVMTGAQEAAIVSPAVGLTVFNTTSNQLEVNIGTTSVPAWISASSASTYTTTSQAVLKSNTNMTGGGNVSYKAGNLSWDSRFLVISNGNGAHFSSNGYFDITMPAIGTVITGVGGSSNATSTSLGIPLAGFQALYYILPIASGNSSVAANFRIATYTSAFVVPETWVLIAVVGDASLVKLGTGQGQNWNLTGNTGTVPGTQYIGTNDNSSLSIRTNGTERVRIDSTTGNVGIGTTTPYAPLQLNNSIVNRKIVLFDNVGNAGNDSAFYGLGINNSTLRYQTPTGGFHSFYNNKTMVAQIGGTGHMILAGTDPAYYFNDRTRSGRIGALYLADGVARIWGSQNTDLFTVDSVGNANVNGNLHIINTPSGALTDSILTINATTGIVNRRPASLGNNIYNNDGTLVGARTVIQAGNTLSFTGGNLSILPVGVGNPLVIDNGVTGTNPRVRTSDTLEFQSTSYNNQLTLLPNGNIGMGKIANNRSLDLLSSNNLDSTARFLANNATQGIELGFQTIRKVGSNVDGDLLFTGKGAGNVYLNNEATGGVGIGMATTPAAKLDINGNLRIGTTISGSNSDSILTIDVATNIVHRRKASDVITGVSNFWSLNAGNIYNNSGAFVGIGTSTPVSNLTIQQSSSGQGIALVGTSVTGPADNNSGVSMVLGYNYTGNRQIWQGDKSAVGLRNGTFTRSGFQGTPTTNTQSIYFDAVSGDGILRRGITLGSYFSNANPSQVQFGFTGQDDTIPSASSVWNTGNMTLGLGYKANAAPSNGLLVQGNVGIATGATAPTHTLEIGGTVGISSSNVLELGSGVTGKNTVAGQIGYQAFTTGALDIVGAGTTNANRVVKLWDNVIVPGTVTAGGTVLTSDRRLKKNIIVLTGALDKVMMLQAFSYEKKASITATNYDQKEMGFIAQDIRKIFPELVSEGIDKDKLLAVNYTALIPLLTKAIQEQQAQNDVQVALSATQKAEIADLKKENVAILAQNATIAAQLAEVKEMKTAMAEMRKELNKIAVVKIAGSNTASK